MQDLTPPARPGQALRLGYVAGVMPGKWERTWAERTRRPLELRMVADAAAEALLRAGELDMCLVRGQIGRDGMHLIPLYREVAVAVVAKDHPATAYDELTLADLAGELDILAEFPELELAMAIETAAAGSGFVLVPMSLARMHRRKDVDYRPVTDAEESPVGLAWLVEHDDPDIETFIGIVRGRTPRSSR